MTTPFAGHRAATRRKRNLLNNLRRNSLANSVRVIGRADGYEFEAAQQRTACPVAKKRFPRIVGQVDQSVARLGNPNFGLVGVHCRAGALPREHDSDIRSPASAILVMNSISPITSRAVNDPGPMRRTQVVRWLPNLVRDPLEQMVANKSLIQARYTLALLGIAKTSERDAALRLLGGLVGDGPLPGVNRELANLHHDAIEAFSGVIDVLQTGSSVAVPPWNAVLNATNRWLGVAELVVSPELRR